MGKASRIKRERREGLASGLNNPIARTAVKVASRSAVLRELSQASTEDNIEVLSRVSLTKVGKALIKKAPHEMDKGIRRLQREGKEVTVKELCREIRESSSFLKMSENAGVPYRWYEELAKERIKDGAISSKKEER